jgi:hypothetical protein
LSGRPCSLVAAAAWLILACSHPASPASPAPPAAAASFRFDWSPPCRVPVVERVAKNDQGMTLAYAIDVRPGTDGNLEVRLLDFEILELNGNDVRGPEWRERLKPIQSIASMVPAFVVTPPGEYVGVPDLEGFVERLLAQYPAETAAQMRDKLLSPAVLAKLQLQISEYWITWVGAWIGWQVAPGQTQRRAGVIDEHLGMDGRFARLRRVQVVVDDDGEKRTTFAAETDPATLRPRRTRFLEETDQERTSRELEWDWSKAVGCGQ